ncbi:hypothetical protein Avbf_08835 [Armadillidium vulgare]|nr:hypothetical protein Avbf_08835 [Armadillidium vulgare]
MIRACLNILTTLHQLSKRKRKLWRKGQKEIILKLRIFNTNKFQIFLHVLICNISNHVLSEWVMEESHKPPDLVLLLSISFVNNWAYLKFWEPTLRAFFIWKLGPIINMLSLVGVM